MTSSSPVRPIPKRIGTSDSPSYVRVTWCPLCRRYVGRRHVCAQPEGLPLDLLLRAVP